MKLHANQWGLLLLVLLTVCCTACQQKTYAEDLSCQEVANALCHPLASEFVSFGEDHLTVIFGDGIRPQEAEMRYGADSMDMSEIGVFRASDAEEAAAMLTAVEAYLSDTLEENRAFLASYAPQELAKLEAAQARCFGRYVVFCICDPEQTEACFESAEQALLA